MQILKNLIKKKPSKHLYTPVVPSGLIAHTEKGYFYVKGKKRFKFVSDRAMLTWSLPIIETREPMMSGFPIDGILGFRDGTLVKDISDGKIYLISDSKRRHITSPDVIEWLDTTILDVGQKEISVHTEGEKLNG